MNESVGYNSNPPIVVNRSTEPTGGLAIRDIVDEIKVDAMSPYWFLLAHQLEVYENAGCNLYHQEGCIRGVSLN